MGKYVPCLCFVVVECIRRPINVINLFAIFQIQALLFLNFIIIIVIKGEVLHRERCVLLITASSITSNKWFQITCYVTVGFQFEQRQMDQIEGSNNSWFIIMKWRAQRTIERPKFPTVTNLFALRRMKPTTHSVRNHHATHQQQAVEVRTTNPPE